MWHIFVINPRSFHTKADLDTIVLEIERSFKNRNCTEFSVYISKFPRDAIGKIRVLMAEIENSDPGSAGREADDKVRVYAVGGDGILFDCLNGIMGLPNVELVSVPYGRSNDYIRSFGEGKNALFRDIGALIDKGVAIPTDLMYCGNNYVITTCCIGMEAAAVVKMKALDRKFHRSIDKFPTLYSFLYIMVGLTSFLDRKLIYQHYDITIDGEDYSGGYTAINIANGPCYGKDMCVSPTAMPDDGYMDISLNPSRGSLTLIRHLRSYLYGMRKPKYIILKRAKKISVRSDRPLIIQLDGEILIDTNITLEIVPHAINMVTVKGLCYERRAAYDA
ncbi:hypothetical protein AGMMS49546_17370 [Spirochaetia bacterium]|nr:hypothetical protein AGMMS49546_17370 [Spirochaetia bacterium]